MIPETASTIDDQPDHSVTTTDSETEAKIADLMQLTGLPAQEAIHQAVVKGYRKLMESRTNETMIGSDHRALR
jgi:hypothetical protein